MTRGLYKELIEVRDEVKALRAENERFSVANAALRRENDRLRAERETLREKGEIQRKGLKAVEDLINESDGVYGYHLNGDLSPWGDFLKGGCNEAYLMEFEKALEGGKP